VLEVTLDGSPGSRPQVKARRVALGADVAPDAEMGRLVARWLEALGRVIREPLKAVATTVHRLEGVEPAVRGRETALGNFLADTIRARLATDVALLNGGAIRINDDVPPGPLRNYDLESLFYYDNDLVAFSLTGAELLEVLRVSVSKIHAGHGRFLQVSGLRFRCHVDGPAEAPRYRIEAADVQVQRRGRRRYEPLELTHRYTVGSVDYLWRSGFRDGYPIFARGRGGTSPTRLEGRRKIGFREATLEAIRRLPDRRIDTRVDGRIELLPAR
jgi:5'-nucleotidase